MKSTHMIVLGLLAASALFNSCEKQSVSPEPTAVVLKFKQPEYKNYILANYLQDAECICGTRFNHCGDTVGQAGFSPYWNLPNDWLLVDWKWFNFPYNAGLALLAERTWDQYPQSEIHPLPTWPLSEPHILQPVETIYYIKAENLAYYRGKTYSSLLLWLLKGGLKDESHDACKNSEWADSLWAQLQNDLSVAIENGDLEHINDNKYNPHSK